MSLVNFSLSLFHSVVLLFIYRKFLYVVYLYVHKCSELYVKHKISSKITYDCLLFIPLELLGKSGLFGGRGDHGRGRRRGGRRLEEVFASFLDS